MSAFKATENQSKGALVCLASGWTWVSRLLLVCRGQLYPEPVTLSLAAALSLSPMYQLPRRLIRGAARFQRLGLLPCTQAALC